MNRRLPEREDVAMWAGHNTHLLYLGAAAVFIASDVMGAPQYSPVGWAASLAGFAFIAALAAQVLVHDRRLCERCAASTPLDPQRAVTRWKQALRLVHAKRATYGLFAVLVAKIVLEQFIRPGTWLYVFDEVTTGAVAVFVVAWWKHSRLQAWCPYCHWGRGGDQEASPEVPDPSVSR